MLNHESTRMAGRETCSMSDRCPSLDEIEIDSCQLVQTRVCVLIHKLILSATFWSSDAAPLTIVRPAREICACFHNVSLACHEAA